MAVNTINCSDTRPENFIVHCPCCESSRKERDELRERLMKFKFDMPHPIQLKELSTLCGNGYKNVASWLIRIAEMGEK